MMNGSFSVIINKPLAALVFLALPLLFYGQQNPLPKAKTGAFWEKVQFGGGIGVSAGSGYTDITVAPSAIYNFNDYVALGTGLQYSYLKQKNLYSSNVFGASLISLFNPVDVVQLSLEVEETNVSNSYDDALGGGRKNFWNTGLFLGAGFRQENITFGGRINLLYDKEKDIYGSAFMPFVRVFF